VKFRVVGRDPLEQRDGLLIALVLVARQADEQLKIARLSDEPILPTRIGEILELFRLFFLLHFSRVPRRHDVNQIAGDPARAFKLSGIGRRFGIKLFEKKTLILDVNQAVEKSLKNIGDYLTAA
jgi:hypothetical protein